MGRGTRCVSRITWALVLSWTSSILPARADEMALAEGSLVRVWPRAAGRGASIEGTLLGLDSVKLTLRQQASSVHRVVPLEEVVRVQARQGRHTGAAMAVGALVGVGVAGVFYLRSVGNEGCDDCLLTAFGIIGVPAALVGASAGALVAPDRWVDVTLPAPAAAVHGSGGRFAVRLAPVSGRGAGVSVSFRF